MLKLQYIWDLIYTYTIKTGSDKHVELQGTKQSNVNSCMRNSGIHHSHDLHYQDQLKEQLQETGEKKVKVAIW